MFDQGFLDPVTNEEVVKGKSLVPKGLSPTRPDGYTEFHIGNTCKTIHSITGMNPVRIRSELGKPPAETAASGFIEYTIVIVPIQSFIHRSDGYPSVCEVPLVLHDCSVGTGYETLHQIHQDHRFAHGRYIEAGTLYP